MLFISDYSQILLPLPIYLLVLLVILSIYAFKYKNISVIHRFRFLFPLVTIWVYIFTTPAIGYILVNQLESGYSEDPVFLSSTLLPKSENNKIIVLSSGFTRHSNNQIKTNLDRSAWERIYTAAKLWKSIGGKLYIAGGPGSDGARPFSTSLKDVAITMGVPETDIFVETESSNTFRNFYFLTKKYDFSGSATWLVTSAFHMNRALGVAKKFSIEARPVACDFKSNNNYTWKAWLPNISSTTLLTVALHELIGTATYRMRDRSR